MTDNNNAGPRLLRDESGAVDCDSVPDVIQWFIDYDERVAVIRHPRVEELFHWKQEQSRRQGEDVFFFQHAEDRLAIGIIQALAHHSSERELHGWIGQLLNALEAASKRTEQADGDYQLNLTPESSVVTAAQKISQSDAQDQFLVDCWVETLCTAEIRVLGWLYQEFYRRPFHPNNF